MANRVNAFPKKARCEQAMAGVCGMRCRKDDCVLEPGQTRMAANRKRPHAIHLKHEGAETQRTTGSELDATKKAPGPARGLTVSHEDCPGSRNSRPHRNLA